MAEFWDGEQARALARAISHLERRRRRYLDERLQYAGLRGGMFMFLLTLERWPGASQESLSSRMDMDKSNIARMARSLEDLGYIRRETDEGDRRQYRLFLAPAGTALLPRIKSSLQSWNRVLTRDLSSEQAAAALAALERMLLSSEEAAGEAPAGERK